MDMFGWEYMTPTVLLISIGGSERVCVGEGTEIHVIDDD